MCDIPLIRWFCIFFLIFYLFSSCTDGKGFGGGRGGGFGGGRGGGFKGSGSFSRSGGYGSGMSKPRTGGSFRSNAMSFGAGAMGGVAAYSLMRSMSSAYHPGPGYYQPGYGYGETCVNNEDMNGTRFGSFRCPLNGFPFEAKYCCGDHGKQYCCVADSTYHTRGAANIGWMFLILILCFIAIYAFAKHRRQTRKNIIMIPSVPAATEQAQPFYQPPPPLSGNPYAPATQNFYPDQPPYPVHQQGMNPYAPATQNFYPDQPSYPVQQQVTNPYAVQEPKPPAYEEVMRSSQKPPTITSN